ncbi:hypothetical protein Q2T40_20585 [Winogradskyella maritima]|uniref:Carboxypeptidase regulatory-like domain-containing protein n=1 Tax=Winogradskyella maritima TaxID=1517766 RepID=A0ABV8ACJ2_9FLAO|nr:hypothetical protein [Winogradskyella maritima]
MRFQIKTCYLHLGFMLLLLNCEIGDDNSQNIDSNSNPLLEIFSERFGQDVSHDFIGKIINVNHTPLSNVIISIGDSQAITDNNGVFVIKNATVKERFAYVKAKKNGYFNASRSLIPTSGTNNVSIVMFEKSIRGTTVSGEETTISLFNGASVDLKGAYENSDGVIHSGNINVVLNYLDATNSEIENQMPGMLYAMDNNTEAQILKTYGMLTVELLTDNGEKLNIAAGSTAQITIPLNQSLLANAPNTIPLWHFDETYGIWVEEGIATLEGNSYVGTVSHFSTWNCDVPFDTANLCINLNDNTSNVMSNANNVSSNLEVVLSAPEYGSISGVFDEQGELCLPVPTNVAITLNVNYVGTCTTDTILDQNIGSFSEDSAIDIYIDSIPSQNLISETITGSFLDCDGGPIANGYVQINHDGQDVISTITDGNFETSLLRCAMDNDFSIIGVDFESNESIGPIFYQFSEDNTDVGDISTCSELLEYMNIELEPYFIFPDGYTKSLSIFENLSTDYSFDAQIDNEGNLVIDWVPFSETIEFRLNTCQFDGVGSYPIVYPDGPCAFGNGNDTQIYFSAYYSENILPFQFFSGTIHITSLGEVGEYIEFNITGESFYTFDAIFDTTITGRVLRDQ